MPRLYEIKKLMNEIHLDHDLNYNLLNEDNYEHILEEIEDNHPMIEDLRIFSEFCSEIEPANFMAKRFIERMQDLALKHNNVNVLLRLDAILYSDDVSLQNASSYLLLTSFDRYKMSELDDSKYKHPKSFVDNFYNKYFGINSLPRMWNKDQFAQFTHFIERRVGQIMEGKAPGFTNEELAILAAKPEAQDITYVSGQAITYIVNREAFSKDDGYRRLMSTIIDLAGAGIMSSDIISHMTVFAGARFFDEFISALDRSGEYSRGVVALDRIQKQVNKYSHVHEDVHVRTELIAESLARNCSKGGRLFEDIPGMFAASNLFDIPSGYSHDQIIRAMIRLAQSGEINKGDLLAHFAEQKESNNLEPLITKYGFFREAMPLLDPRRRRAILSEGLSI